jgi:ABC-2 type transport system permease protein
MVILLLKPKILALKNSVNRKTVLKRLPLLSMGIGFWILLYIGTSQALSYLRGIEFFGEILSQRFLAITFFSLMGFMVLSNIITALSSFYLSKDIPFLLSKPLETIKIIKLKAIETILNSSWMVLSFIPPVFFAYGVNYKAPVIFYVYIVIAFIMFVLITGGIGISVAHILTRLFPAHRTREVLLGLSLLLFIVLYFVIKSIVPHDPSSPEDLISSIINFKADSPLLPSFWITKSTTSLLQNRGFEYFYTAVLLVNSLFFIVLAEMIGLWLYRENIERIEPAGKGSGLAALKSIYPNHRYTLFYKDVKIFFRDTAQWSQIFIIGALIMVYIYNFRSIPIKELSVVSPFIREIMVLVNMVMAGLILSAVAARFIYSSISLEGKAFWILKTSPITMSRFLWSKLLYGCIPVTLLVVILVFLSNRALDVEGPLMYISVATISLLCISVSGLGTGFGAIYPNFKYDNIASVSMSLGGMVFMLIAFTVVLVTLGLEAWIYYLSKVKTSEQNGLALSDVIAILSGATLIILVNSAAFYLPMRIGKRKIQGDIVSL